MDNEKEKLEELLRKTLDHCKAVKAELKALKAEHKAMKSGFKALRKEHSSTMEQLSESERVRAGLQSTVSTLTATVDALRDEVHSSTAKEAKKEDKCESESGSSGSGGMEVGEVEDYGGGAGRQGRRCDDAPDVPDTPDASEISEDGIPPLHGTSPSAHVVFRLNQFHSADTFHVGLAKQLRRCSSRALGKAVVDVLSGSSSRAVPQEVSVTGANADTTALILIARLTRLAVCHDGVPLVMSATRHVELVVLRLVRATMGRASLFHSLLGKCGMVGETDKQAEQVDEQELVWGHEGEGKEQLLQAVAPRKTRDQVVCSLAFTCTGVWSRLGAWQKAVSMFEMISSHMSASAPLPSCVLEAALDGYKSDNSDTMHPLRAKGERDILRYYESILEGSSLEDIDDTDGEEVVDGGQISGAPGRIKRAVCIRQKTLNLGICEALMDGLTRSQCPRPSAMLGQYTNLATTMGLLPALCFEPFLRLSRKYTYGDASVAANGSGDEDAHISLMELWRHSNAKMHSPQWATEEGILDVLTKHWSGDALTPFINDIPRTRAFRGCVERTRNVLWISIVQYCPMTSQWVLFDPNCCNIALSKSLPTSKSSEELIDAAIERTIVGLSLSNDERAHSALTLQGAAIHHAGLTSFPEHAVARAVACLSTAQSRHSMSTCVAHHSFRALLGLLAAYTAELCTAVFALSLRGLLRAWATTTCVTAGPVGPAWLAVIEDCMDCLAHLPPPWGGVQNVGLVRDLLLAGRRLQALRKASIPITLPSPGFTEFMTAAAASVPVLVINLDRRQDRMRAFVTMCAQHSMCPIRISAVDARALSVNTSGTDAVSSPDPLMNVVSTHWDSTVNCKFDRSCHLSTATPMTVSERACAASHMKAWGVIAASGPCPTTAAAAVTAAVGDASSAVQGLNLLASLRDGNMTPASTREGGEFEFDDDTDNTERRSNEEWFLICEDDAFVCEIKASKSLHTASLGIATGAATSAFPAAMRAAVDALPPGADILYLGRAVPPNAWGKPYKAGLVQVKYAWQLHAYLIPRRTAKRLVRELPVDCPADNFIARLVYDGTLTAYTVDTQLMRQPKEQIDRSHTDIAHSGRLDQRGANTTKTAKTGGNKRKNLA